MKIRIDIYIQWWYHKIERYLQRTNDAYGIVTVLRVLQDGMDWQNIIKRFLSKHL